MPPTIAELLESTVKGAKAKKSKKVQTNVAEVIRHGTAIIIPAGMTKAQALQIMQAQAIADEQKVTIVEDLDTFVWDGAYAFSLAMEQRYGLVGAETKVVETFFGKMEYPPTLIAVECEYGKTINIPWGTFSLPGVTGTVETQANRSKNKLTFKLVGNVLRRDEAEIHELMALAREILKTRSLYKGKAFKISFTDEDGDPIPQIMPKFLNLAEINPAHLIYPDDVASAIETNLFTPLQYQEECKAYGIPFKRGILLAGTYGTGKTLAAYVTAKIATENNVTFVYAEKIDDFAEVVKFASQYAPAVVFCEDIDRVMSGERNIDMDTILNVVDGIESKNASVMVVLTTNHVDKINQAMIRPGRLDAVIEVKAPDAKAAQKLMRHYGCGLIPESEDLSEVGVMLKGAIPAIIREVVERAKLSAIRRSGEDLILTASDLKISATTMQMQLDLLNRKQAVTPSEMEKLGNAIGHFIFTGLKWSASNIKRELETLNDAQVNN